MAHVEVSKLSSQEVAELACTYAALILHDDEQDITGERISKLITAAGVKVESYWPKIFAKAIEGKDISSFFNFGGASAAPAAASSAPVAAQKTEEKPAAKKQQKKQAPPPPPAPAAEEEDMDMGDLFG